VKALLLPAIVGVGLVASAFQTGSPVVEAESCNVELTKAGQADWRGGFYYLANTDREGRISKLELRPPTSETLKAFIRLDQLESCVRRWQFSGAGPYSITFYAGTSGDALSRWTISVSNAQGSFRLVFPRV